jgi:glycerol-3-phosphate dehydrogenase (NAD(P)+)
MVRVAIFGAGAMGTAMAMHASRRGATTTLWANQHDLRAYAALQEERRHPLLPEHVPDAVRICGPHELDQAAEGAEVAVMGANSHGARSLARMVKGHLGAVDTVVSVAKGLEPETHLRMSEVYEAELPGVRVIAIGGPCLAAELAEGLPTAGVWASRSADDAAAVGDHFSDRHYQLQYSDDVVGVELCSMMKNVAAIGLGMLDGLGSPTGRDFKNAKAALFTKAAHELVELVGAAGGRSETVFGLAGVGDQLVTSLGGRNRLYGELVGAGDPPEDTLEELEGRGLTIEGVDSTREVRRLAVEHGLELPYHTAIHRVLFEDARPEEILEVLR